MTDETTHKHTAMPLPMQRSAVVDRYFLEHRAKLLDLAAFLDRCDRASGIALGSPRSPTVGPTTDDAITHDDFRLTALRRAITLLTDDQPQRTARILELLSDMSEAPLDHAHTQGATGAPAAETPEAQTARDKSRG